MSLPPRADPFDGSGHPFGGNPLIRRLSDLTQERGGPYAVELPDGAEGRAVDDPAAPRHLATLRGLSRAAALKRNANGGRVITGEPLTVGAEHLQRVGDALDWAVRVVGDAELDGARQGVANGSPAPAGISAERHRVGAGGRPPGNRLAAAREEVRRLEASGSVPLTRREVAEVSPDGVELALATPDEQADVAVRLAEERQGRPLTPEEIRERARPIVALGAALVARADERERNAGALGAVGLRLEDVEVSPGSVA